MLRRLFIQMKQGTEHLNYGRHIIAKWAARIAAARKAITIADIGCGHGTDLENARQAIQETGYLGLFHLVGIENHPPYIAECRAKGIQIIQADIEHDRIDLPEASCDIVIANQVLEHTKELFWIASELARITRPKGLLIVGVPNLASLHNRLLLLFGEQPTAQQSASAHVRSFTAPDFKRFIELGGLFRLKEIKGSNFYPFPPFLSRPLSRLFPRMAWGIFFLCERTEKKGSFLDILSVEPLETPFYGGPQNPAKPSKSRRGPRKAGKPIRPGGT